MPFFQESERLNVNGGNFFDASNNVVNVNGSDTRKGKGIKLLLASSVQREAMHDSDSRGDLGCHPGTREEYIRNIASWGSGEWQSEKRAFLMTGPAGAGKSAIARTCAHKIEATGKLGASFFFFRPSGWNDPKKFIPTIVYQLTTRYSAYRDCINDVILDDPLVLEKAMDIQFRELLVKPLQELSAGGHDVGRDMIVIDGLDECATVEAQVQIINLITASIHEKTTPFLWAFFSRPEPPITSAFSSRVATNISWTLPLTLSADADSDIEAYLRGSFEIIRAKHSFPKAVDWPGEENIRRLVSQSAGLFAYPATAIRYINGFGEGKSGLEERLRAVLELDGNSTENPFSALDQLYTLIMRQIPEGVLPNTMSLLYLYHHLPPILASHCSALGLSSAEFHVAISNLYSVLEVTLSDTGNPDQFQFYHTSFTDFLLDSRRSKQYWIESPGVRQHVLEKIVSTLRTQAHVDPRDAVEFHLLIFFRQVRQHDGKLEENILRHILQVDWNFWCRGASGYPMSPKDFMKKIPIRWRNRIIRPYYKGTLDLLLQKLAILWRGSFAPNAYVLGNGDKKCLLVRDGYNHPLYDLHPFP